MGSSMMTIWGSPIRAWAIPRRCIIPLEYFLMLIFLAWSSPTSSRRSWWVIKLEGNHTELLREWGFKGVSTIGHLTQVEVAPQDLWQALEKVRSQGIPLYSLERKRLTLEDIFVKEVKGEA